MGDKEWMPPPMRENPTWLSRNRNKRSICIGLKTAEGKQNIYDLVPTSDVVFQNFRPGVMERLGVGYEDLKLFNPRIIYASGSGHGPTGPYSQKGGQDRAAQVLGGVTGMNRDLDGPPRPVGASTGDIMAGIFLAQGILLALIHRDRPERANGWIFHC